MENFQDRGVWIRIRFVLRGWIRIRVRIRSISDRIRNPAYKAWSSSLSYLSLPDRFRLFRWGNLPTILDIDPKYLYLHKYIAIYAKCIKITLDIMYFFHSSRLLIDSQASMILRYHLYFLFFLFMFLLTSDEILLTKLK